MTKLHQIVSAILQDVVLAGTVSDKFSREISQAYGADPVLRHFPVPRALIKEITLDLKMALAGAPAGGESDGPGFTVKKVFEAFTAAVQAVNSSSIWQMATNEVLTADFRAALFDQFVENLNEGLVAILQADNLPADFASLNIEEHWAEVSGAFRKSLEQSLHSLMQAIGKEALDPVFVIVGDVTNADNLLLKLADGIEQTWSENEERSVLIESFLEFMQSESLTSKLQGEINQLLSAEPPENRASLFTQNIELDTEALIERLTDIFIELLFVVIEESGNEELFAQMEEQGIGLDEIQGELREISAATFGIVLNPLADMLQLENRIQSYLQSLESRFGESLMELVHAAAESQSFPQLLQEAYFQFVTTHAFHPDSVVEDQGNMAGIFISQLIAANEEEMGELSELIGFSKSFDIELVQQMAFQALMGSQQLPSNASNKFDLDVVVDSSQLQHLPPEVISSLQITLTLEDDLWPSFVADS